MDTPGSGSWSTDEGLHLHWRHAGDFDLPADVTGAFALSRTEFSREPNARGENQRYRVAQPGPTLFP